MTWVYLYQGFIYIRLYNLSITWVLMKKCAIYYKNNKSIHAHLNTKTAHKIAYFLQYIIFRKAVSTETESPILINTYMHCILITKLNNPYFKKLTLLDSFTTLNIIFIWSLSFSVSSHFSSVVRYNFSLKKWLNI